MPPSSSCCTGSHSACLVEIVSGYFPDVALAKTLNRMTQRMGMKRDGPKIFGTQLIALEKELHAEEISMLYFLNQLPSPTSSKSGCNLLQIQTVCISNKRVSHLFCVNCISGKQLERNILFLFFKDS